MNWTAQDIPDLTGKTAIVTGANIGIGLETARALAAKGACVVLACRNTDKAAEAKINIENTVPNTKLEIIRLDLASLASVREFATSFMNKYSQLDILVNNAGIMAPPLGKTMDGFESQFGANHLGHFALTGLLLPRLKNTARVVMVSSAVERNANMDFLNLNAEKNYVPFKAYGQSKLANLLFCYELARRFKSAGMAAISVAAHPGWTATNLQQHSPIFQFFNRFLAQLPAQGAWPSLYAATAAGVENASYFGPNGFMEMRGHPKLVQSSVLSHDSELAKELWKISEERTGVQFPIS